THISFYLLLTPPPPRSPLFPYTTLFRSAALAVAVLAVHLAERLLPEQLAVGVQAVEAVRAEEGVYPLTVGDRVYAFFGSYGLYRSEEHTSELQSRGHLVCRLLLEKKNIK